MRPPREEWQQIIGLFDELLSLVVGLIDERPKPGDVRRCELVKAKLEEFRDTVWGSEDCEKP